MKSLVYKAFAVAILTTLVMSFRPKTSQWVYCVNPVTSRCDVEVFGRSTVDQGLGVAGILHCAVAPTNFICPAITIYYGD